MKKIFLILTGLIIIVIAVYVLIPSKIYIDEEISIDSSDVIAARFLNNKSNWKRWWPGTTINDNLYRFKSLEIDLGKMTNSTVYFNLKKGDIILKNSISVFAGEEGTVTVKWNASEDSSKDFYSKLTNYFEKAAIRAQMAEVLLSLKRFLQDERNTYGYKIYINLIKDTVLLTHAEIRNSIPEVHEIYQIVNNLKQEADKGGVKQVAFPMLNVTKINEYQYQVTVALPINKTVHTQPKTTINEMPKGANLLVLDVKGGQNTINNALSQLKIYMKDHRLVSPAMSYQSLVTDRSVEKDTSKWVTKIYYPIF
ncbi:hypothetical protein [Mucilaginibacter kameinonensis]|uniref:hypothetical protein n=1 Tax=Mucilaginibacter kameinonensis TaxID=452286 RepID=UPI000EF7D614|nr:hypothetical protein [Mucilaginibacter kameinonensis]